MARKENEMRKTVVVSILLLLVGLAVSGCSQGMMGSMGTDTVKSVGPPPIITDYFAAKQGEYGDVLKVYIAAEDPSGDMEKIAIRVTQVGYGFYPYSWVYLKPKYQKKIVGYLQWNTSSSEAESLPEWTQLSITIQIIDRGGNQSNVVVLPHQFVTGKQPTPLLPAPFNQGKMTRVGWIDVELVDPSAPGDWNR